MKVDMRWFFLFKNGSEKKSAVIKQIQEEILLNPETLNITDGSEFLDDSIRMHDQDLGSPTVDKQEPHTHLL